MQPVVVFTDAEKVVIDYLTPALTAGVSIDVEGAAARFVRVRRVGGVEATVAHDRPRLDVMVWHDADKTRMELAQALWARLRAAAGERQGDSVLYYSSTFLGPRQMPDPANSSKRVCMFTVEMTVRPA